MNVMPHLSRKVFLPLSLWRSGELAQLRYAREFERSQWASEEELRALQLGRLQALLAHAYDNCPFYRERFERAGLHPRDVKTLEDLRALPPLEKEEVQASAADMVARNWPEEDLIRNQTGGSTGTPVTFYLSSDRKCSRAAATWRHNAWAGWRYGDRAAVIWGAPRDRPGSTLRDRMRSWLLGEPIWLDTGHVTEASMEAFHARLHRHKPRIILAYARSAVLFARFLEQRSLTPHRPDAIVTSAEVLEDAERALLERVFGCKVFNRYGCREVSVIASECDRHSGLHVMAEGLYLEIQTPQGPAAPGEVGSVLVTDLLNPAMPLIRYRIGDMAAWAKGSCECGRGLPRLERIAGRVTDYLVGADGRLVSGAFLTAYVVAERTSLGQVQIVQDQQGVVKYRIRPGATFDAGRDIPDLVGVSKRFLGEDTRIEWELVAELPHEPSGKFLFSRSSVAVKFMQGRCSKS